MRENKIINDNWKFVSKDIDVSEIRTTLGELVNLPHTWNNIDGQDGGNDYYRGRCWYVKEFSKPTLNDEELWLEFKGVAMVADVYVNGKHLEQHKGGYSTFRVNVTEVLEKENVIAVAVDNSYTREVYPQKADFTFYGGIYRDITLIKVPKTHFALGYCGGDAVKVTSKILGSDAEVTVEAWTENAADGTLVDIKIGDVNSKSVEVKDNKIEVVLTIPNVHLWNGIEDPYMYEVQLNMGNDEIKTQFGCRTFAFNQEKGFFLNGKEYPLCGVSRHQDRQGVGNAITKEMQDEDMEIMLEMGANTIRLAHYQHDQYFYDLCDKVGMIIWAEIPYITEHMPEANENSYTQLKELIIQNYNHPSIVCWGLSNEITVTGGVNDDMVENHKRLNDLAHELDKTRPTAVANVFMLETDSDFLKIPDIRSYNLYYGWYVGEVQHNDEWFDNFHRDYPEMIIGLSEYGADGNPQYQSANPQKGDWTESYQAVYHEHMLKMWSERPYIWAMHAWNMFDFGADGRDEGGKPGQNQKGLVTFDRALKKDAFYIYKAYLSKVPFVHLCGRRYVDRVEEVTEIKVYSNLSEVTLFVDGKEFGTKSGDKVFKFEVSISGEHIIEVRNGELTDKIKICKVDEPNLSYFAAGKEVTNWFDKPEIEIRDGYYTILDSTGEIKAIPEAAEILARLTAKAAEAYGDVAKNIEIPENIQKIMDAMSVVDTLKQLGDLVTPEILTELNNILIQVKKPN